MIDCKTYHRLDANDTFRVKDSANEAAKREKARRKAAGKTRFASDRPTFEKFSDEDALLTNATVRGFSFTAKKFLEFFVDNISPIQWNKQCFDDLVLDPNTKKTVQALVSMHSKDRESMDDIVDGKGQGLVCVLHGPPGVGKTLTAECVAEYVQRPLYMVSSGDLGVSSTTLDDSLTRIMDMTSTWRAVLLIDEADVFLERRSLHDLHRNAMVSVFLRVLEYYKGILFLTTNRVNTFDDAFKSRIHIPIRYTDLSQTSRLQIWRNFCTRVPRRRRHRRGGSPHPRRSRPQRQTDQERGQGSREPRRLRRRAPRPQDPRVRHQDPGPLRARSHERRRHRLHGARIVEEIRRDEEHVHVIFIFLPFLSFPCVYFLPFPHISFSGEQNGSDRASFTPFRIGGLLCLMKEGRLRALLLLLLLMLLLLLFIRYDLLR